MTQMLQTLRADPSGVGIFLDFDGTLAPIVDDPATARPLPGIPEALEAAARRFALVAVVSGRRAEEVVRSLGADVEVWGNHGAESATRDGVRVSPAVSGYVATMSEVRDVATARCREAGVPGILVEDKGVAVALHYRMASDRKRARDITHDLAEELVGRFGVRRKDGRMIVELRPPVDLDKGTVVRDRVRALGLRAAMFVGDDRVDLSAFDALDELARDGTHCVRVAVSSEEAPPELLERADLTVQGPAGVIELLRDLVR